MEILGLFARFHLGPRLRHLTAGLKGEIPRLLGFLALGALVLWALSYAYGPKLFPWDWQQFWPGLGALLLVISGSRRKPTPPAQALFFRSRPASFARRWEILQHLSRSFPLFIISVFVGIWYLILLGGPVFTWFFPLALMPLWLVSGLVPPPRVRGSQPTEKRRPGFWAWFIPRYAGSLLVFGGLGILGVVLVYTDNVQSLNTFLSYGVFVTVVWYFLTAGIGKTLDLKSWLVLRLHRIPYPTLALRLSLIPGVLGLVLTALVALKGPPTPAVWAAALGLVFFPGLQWALAWWITRKYPLLGGLASLGAAGLFGTALITGEILPILGCGVLLVLATVQAREIYAHHEVEDHVEG